MARVVFAESTSRNRQSGELIFTSGLGNFSEVTVRLTRENWPVSSDVAEVAVRRTGDDVAWQAAGRLAYAGGPALNGDDGVELTQVKWQDASNHPVTIRVSVAVRFRDTCRTSIQCVAV